MTTTEGRYLFPHSWEREGERLTALASAFDPITRRHLLARGLTGGWRCLEVGAGTGTIAGWLADQVGPKGRVLATDIGVELMERQGLAAGNLEVRRHDILTDPLPDEEFDLVHCRFVLEHLPGRLDALARMAGALAPGGWLVVEDITFGTERAATRKGAAVITGVVGALKLLLRRHGHDANFGGCLPVHLARLGLTEVGAEGTQLVLVGGTPSVDWTEPTFARLRHLLFDDDGALAAGPLHRVFDAAPAVRRAAERRLDQLHRLLADPEFVFLAPTFVSAWARRPGGPGD